MQPTKEQLIDLYHKKNMTYKQIAALYNVAPTTVAYWVKKKFDIPNKKRKKLRDNPIAFRPSDDAYKKLMKLAGKKKATITSVIENLILKN